jgi:hypothetical protein
MTRIFSPIQGIPIAVGGVTREETKLEEQRVLEWKKEGDVF